MAELLLATAALALLTLACLRLRLSLPAAAFAYLILVTLLSLRGRFVPVLLVSGLAVVCLDFFFAAPVWSFDVAAEDLVVVIAFVISALVVTALVGRARMLQEQMRGVVDTIPVVAWSKLPDGSADYLSRRFREFTGLSREQGRGWGWMQAFHPDDRNVDAWRAAFAAALPFEKEARLRRADGVYRWCLLRAVPVRDARGRVVRWYGTTGDIDDRRRAEQELAEHAHLLDLTHDTVFARDMRDVITYWNRGAAELYGWSGAEAVGRVTHDLLHTKFPAPLEHITAALLRDRRWEGELVHTKRDGTQVVVSSRWALRLDDRRTPVAILETNNDVTERKRAEETVRQAADLLAQAHDAIIVWNFPGNIVYWNRGAQQLYGFSSDEAIGRLTHELLRTEHATTTAEFEAMLERDRSWTGEVTQTTRDGRKVVVDSRHVLVNSQAGGVLVFETNRDVSDRKLAEYLTEQAFESSPDAICIIGRDFGIQRANSVFGRYWGSPRDSILGLPLGDVMPTKTFEVAKPYLARCFGGEQVNYSGWFRLAVGRRYMTVTATPLRPHAEHVEAALVIAHDLTDHVLAAEALRDAQAALAHVSRVTTLGEVAASIAHELNQPLAAIVNNASACLALLEHGRHDVGEVREALSDIASDGQRASAIIERIRGLVTRSSAERSPLRLRDVVDDVLALASAESTARGVAIRRDVAGDLPVVMGDRVQLQQVLLNLIVNGMDAMSAVPAGERVLEIRGRHDGDGDNPAVRISVRDRGVGLDSAEAKRLFEAFYTTKPGGMGMGLAISRSIVDAHGGRLWAEANDGPGATFSFALPASTP